MGKSDVEKCIAILQSAKTDNEQFAALLMVTKVIKAEECDSATRRRVFDAIGFPFLSRLLKSKTVPEGCPENTYRSLAVTILSCFCSDPALVTDKHMLGCLPQLNNIITSLSSENEDPSEHQMIDDTYDCLTCMIARQEGRKALIMQHTVTALCETTIHKCYGYSRGWKLLRSLMQQSDHLSIWRGNEPGLESLLTDTAKRMRQEKDGEKFEICKHLNFILSSVDKAAVEKISSEWSIDVYHSVTSILQSKIGSMQRDPALQLAALVCEVCGVSWALGPDGQNTKFLLLLVHLTCIEVRMTLEDKQFSEVVRQVDLLCSCYNLLEHIISYMTSAPSLALDEKQMMQLHAAMVGGFNAVIFFLSDIHHEHPDQKLSSIVLASVRVLGSWIAEETVALQEEITKLLPFLLDVGKESFHLTKDNNELKEMEKLSLDAARCEEGGEDVALVQSETQPVTDVVKFLLPGLCHLSAEDKARAILLEENFHDLLSEYFMHRWTVYAKHSQDRDAEMALMTMCGIFLNLAVLEPQLVGSHHVFIDILQFIMNTIPCMDIHSGQIVLSFNFAVLGLMLLRHQSQKQEVGGNELEGFVVVCISLLRNAHKCSINKTKSGQSVLELADPYSALWESLSELWFLGMQAMCAVVPLYSVVTSAILKSGWLPAAVKMLNTVSGSGVGMETAVSYRCLFCELAKADPQAKAIILEKGAKQLVKSYKFEELGKILDI